MGSAVVTSNIVDSYSDPEHHLTSVIYIILYVWRHLAL